MHIITKNTLSDNRIKILIVVATEPETAVLKNMLKRFKISENIFKFQKLQIKILITGIGLVNTAYLLTKEILQNEYDLAINIGICGSFDFTIPLGEVLEVKSDTFADLGITYPDKFRTVFEENFINPNLFPYTNSLILNEDYKLSEKFELKKVNSISVNTTSGNKEQISERKKKFNPDIETMEGAAFFAVCKSENLTCLQIRSVSNYVEERNFAKWDIPLAISSLNHWILNFIINYSA